MCPDGVSAEVALATHVVLRPGADGSIVIAFGSGDRRAWLTCSSSSVVRWLISLRGGRDRDGALEDAMQMLGVSREDARRLLECFGAEGLVLEGGARPSDEGSVTDEVRDDRETYRRAVRDVAFMTGDERGHAVQEEDLRGLLGGVARGVEPASPPPTKDYPDAPTTPLVGRRRLLDVARVGRTLEAVGVRAPTAKRALRRERLDALLVHALGVTGSIDIAPLGLHQLRTFPSDGARHPVEAYLLAIDVENLGSGVYHVGVDPPALQQIELGLDRGRAASVIADELPVEASAVVLLTLRWARHQWKYRYARSFEAAHFDLGHAAANLELVGVALGLACRGTLAVSSSGARRLLGLPHDLEESALYAVVIGEGNIT